MSWPRIPTRRLFRVVNGGTPTSDPKNWDGDIKWITPVDLAAINGGIIEDSQRSITPTGLASGSCSVPRGSIILSTRAPIGYVAETVVVTAFNQGCRGLIPLVDIDTRFFRYHYLAIADNLAAQGLGSTFMELSGYSLAAAKVSSPPLSIQRAVADFLDAETSRIDALVAKQDRLIALLEQRFAVKTAMLLAGSDQSQERKRSTGIPSIPEIPSAWQLCRNKKFLHEVNSPSLDGQEELLSVSHISGVTSRSEKEVNMFMAESLEGYKKVSVGDLVINTMWAWMGAAGVSPIEGIVSPAYGVYRFDQCAMLPLFFDALVRTRAYIDEMTRFSKGVWSSRLRLYPDEFLRLSSPMPPLSEQYRIVNKITAIRQIASRSCTVLKKEIGLLQERRQAIITAAVTGEMDVPGARA